MGEGVLRPGDKALHKNPAHGANLRSRMGRGGVDRMPQSSGVCNSRYDFPHLEHFLLSWS